MRPPNATRVALAAGPSWTPSMRLCGRLPSVWRTAGFSSPPASPALTSSTRRCFANGAVLPTGSRQERDFLRWRQRLDERRREWDLAGRHADDLLPRTLWTKRGAGLRRTRPGWASHKGTMSMPVPPPMLPASISSKPAAFGNVWSCAGVRVLSPITSSQRCSTWRRRRPMTKHEFLLSGLRSEALARRLGRLPEIAIRAALGLDLALAARFASSLVEFCRFPASLQYEQLWASISLGRP